MEMAQDEWARVISDLNYLLVSYGLYNIRLSSDVDEKFVFWVSFFDLFINTRPVAELRSIVSFGLVFSIIY